MSNYRQNFFGNIYTYIEQYEVKNIIDDISIISYFII